MKQYAVDERGSSAAEFALVLPALLVLVLGVFHLCTMVYGASSLHWAVEQAARCAALSQKNPSLSCGTIANTQTYAAAAYHGPNLGIVTTSFTPVIDATNKCRKVTGAGTYSVNAGVFTINAPISATACFPADTSAAWPA